MTKIGKACFVLGIFLQTGWGRTLITSCSSWWWSWETFSTTWAPANETSLARSYWNERGKAGASWLAGGQYADHVVVLREFMRCMCGQRSSLGLFVICMFFLICQGNVSLAGIPLGTASLGGRPFDVNLCRLSLLVLLHVCFTIEARLFPDISSRPQHMYWAWEMIIKAHHPKAGRQMISTQYF